MHNDDRYNDEMEEREEKKPFYKRGWFIAIAILVAISMLMPSKDKGNEEAAKGSAETEAQVVETTEAKTETEKVTENTERTKVLSDEEEILSILNQEETKEGHFIYNEEHQTFLFVVTTEGGKAYMDGVIAGENQEDWATLSENIRSISEGISMRYPKDYLVAVQNPHNEERVLVQAQRGIITYNVQDEMDEPEEESLIGYTIDKRNYTMTINDYEIVEPKYGSRGDVLMFHVTFTNKSDRPVSPWMAMLFRVDQETDVTVEMLKGGIPYEGYEPEKVEMANAKVKPGATVEAAFGFEILLPGEPAYVRDFFGNAFEFVIDTSE